MLAFPAFLDGVPDILFVLAGTLLDAPDEFMLLAFQELKIVMGDLGELLLQLAPENVPNSFGRQNCHTTTLCCFCVHFNRVHNDATMIALQEICRARMGFDVRIQEGENRLKTVKNPVSIDAACRMHSKNDASRNRGEIFLQCAGQILAGRQNAFLRGIFYGEY